jgi:hypothetical protein
MKHINYYITESQEFWNYFLNAIGSWIADAIENYKAKVEGISEDGSFDNDILSGNKVTVGNVQFWVEKKNKAIHIKTLKKGGLENKEATSYKNLVSMCTDFELKTIIED